MEGQFLRENQRKKTKKILTRAKEFNPLVKDEKIGKSNK